MLGAGGGAVCATSPAGRNSGGVPPDCCRRAGRAACAGTASADKILVPMDLAQTDHLKAYGLAYWCLEQGFSVEWLLNYRGGSFMVDAADLVARKATLMGVGFDVVAPGDGRRDLRDNGKREHGRGAPGEGAGDRGLRAARQGALGRRRDAGPGLRRDTLHRGLRRGGARRRPGQLRLASPSPRGLHRAVRQVLLQLSHRRLVQAAGGDGGGDRQEAGLRQGVGAEGGGGPEDQGVRRPRRLPLLDVLGHRLLRHRARRRGRRHRRRGLRRRPAGSALPAEAGLLEVPGLHRLQDHHQPDGLRVLRHRHHPEGDAARPAQRLLHALRILGQAGPDSRRCSPRTTWP